MDNPPGTRQRIFLTIGVILTWFALIAQFVLHISNRQTSVPESILRYFTYFTILTNILVALCFTILLLAPGSRWGHFFSRIQTLTSIATYITIVGIIYNVILRFTWSPTGLQKPVDEILHLVNPLFFILYWIMFAPKNGLKWINAIPWLLFPLIYIIIVLARGAYSGFYPYPFLDVNTLGYYQVLLNCGAMCAAFLFLSFLFIGCGMVMEKKVKNRDPFR